jgi:hypothetical protein
LSCRKLLLQRRRQGQFGKCGHSRLFFLEGPVEIHVGSLDTREAFMPLALFELRWN